MSPDSHRLASSTFTSWADTRSPSRNLDTRDHYETQQLLTTMKMRNSVRRTHGWHGSGGAFPKDILWERVSRPAR